MTPSNGPSKLHYIGLIEVGKGFFTKCEKCKTWAWCKAYRKQYAEGRAWARELLCKECMEAGQ